MGKKDLRRRRIWIEELDIGILKILKIQELYFEDFENSRRDAIEKAAGV